MSQGPRLSLLAVLWVVLVAGCATSAHDTLAFKGVVYSRDSQVEGTRTTAVPVAGGGTVFLNSGGGTFNTYILKLDDGTTYAVRSYNSFEVGACLAVYMTAERAQSAGYLNVKETTVVPATGCKAKVSN